MLKTDVRAFNVHAEGVRAPVKRFGCPCNNSHSQGQESLLEGRRRAATKKLPVAAQPPVAERWSRAKSIVPRDAQGLGATLPSLSPLPTPPCAHCADSRELYDATAGCSSHPGFAVAVSWRYAD